MLRSVHDCGGVLTAGQAAVEELHARYVTQLRGLWDKYKDRYALQRKGTFRMVE